MSDPAGNDDQELLRRALDGDEPALAALFDGSRDRLRKMIRLRLDRRLSGRVDTSDVLQDAYLDVRRRFAEYARDPSAMPFHPWLRLVAGQRLTDVHRHHLGSQMRDAGREVSLHRGPFPQASSISLAAQLLGKMTSVSKAAIRAEHKLIVQEALNAWTRSTVKSWPCGISSTCRTTRPHWCSGCASRRPATDISGP